MRTLRLILMGCIAVFCLSGCVQEDRERISLTITDGYVSTMLESVPGQTVSALLKEAEIDLGERDQVTPDLGTVISENEAQIDILRYAEVSVLDGEKEIPVALLGGTVADALKEAKVAPGPHDVVDREPEMLLSDGLQIRIVHLSQVKWNCDGKQELVLTGAHTVEEFVKEQNVTMGEEDRILPGMQTKITEGMEITLERVSVHTETVEEEIPFETKTENDATILPSKSYTKQKGVNGVKQLTYEITYVDGVEESRTLVKEEVTVEPVTEIKVQGTKKEKTKTVVSKEKVYDCDGSGHGYWIITYSDGSVKYKNF